MVTTGELERYKRQILLFGEDGQERLKEATIFIAGAGGLGSPISLYLAAAGVGRLIIVDNDDVDLTNLNRQILHGDSSVGERKTDSAARRLRDLNADIEVVPIDRWMDEESIGELILGADGIVDAMDNFPTRYLLNKAAHKEEIPFFHGGIRGFYGQATTVVPGKTACFACIFPHTPPEEVIPVVGVTAGFIGMVQANEVIKYLLGTGELLTNRLLLWDGMRSEVDTIPIDKNPDCPVCGR
ncbi:adenylyltransferase/sulfurtransferase [Methanocalculus alkaliphilus]|uniref:HesA/MoeB/ThiF family protein n=1 Tax=Methanocalculus alkaliphilus TaxID=768730 RepID=UPI0020A226CE|nr:HesA/MoeB/ThiF family protein [Methanocalculus alkaliphilus]MCP1716243.1 adenylyltransferase/sulfurtransferase [Methanocalculus alkaliphilus]